MRISVFSSVLKYFKDIWRGVESILTSSFSALPYLFSIGELRKEVTEQYPDPVSSRGQDDLPPRTRGFLKNDIDRCTGCGDCQEICPVRCISVQTEPGSEKTKTWISVFDIDLARCTACGLCVDICEPRSLVHTKEFEKATRRPEDLVMSFGRGWVTPELREKWDRMRMTRRRDWT